jgi:hypothetical protein
MPSGEVWAVLVGAPSVRGPAVGDHAQCARTVWIRKRHAAGTQSACSVWRSNLTSHPSRGLGPSTLIVTENFGLQTASCKLQVA